MADPTKDSKPATTVVATQAQASAAAPPTAPPAAAEPKREYRVKHRIVGEREIRRDTVLRLTDAEAAQYGDSVELTR
jgi:hypothetical protein